VIRGCGDEAMKRRGDADPPRIKYGVDSSGSPVEKTGFRIKSGMTIFMK